MRNFIDSVFNPFINWLNTLISYLFNLSVPLSRPLNLSKYFGYFNFLGPVWTTIITSLIGFTVLYLVLFVIIRNLDMLIKFKSLIKWW